MKTLKAISLIIIILFSCIAVSPVSGKKIKSLDVKTWYVDDDGGADFTSIQDAIDNASDGDTVFVYNGTYNEALVIKKSIVLSGENNKDTIIDGYGNNKVIKVISENVKIEGFCIKNGSKGIFADDTNFTIIVDNRILNNDYGITLGENSHGHEDNIFNAEISNNKIYDNQNGIHLVGVYNTKVTNNDIYDNDDDGYGIFLSRGSENIINENYLKNTGGCASFGSFCEITYNNIFNGSISILGDDNIISHNKIDNGDIGFSGAHRNEVSYNKIIGHGLTFFDSSKNNIVEYNQIEGGNSFWGIYLDGGCKNTFNNNDLLSMKFMYVHDWGSDSTWYHNYWGRPRLFPKQTILISNLMIAYFYIYLLLTEPLSLIGKERPRLMLNFDIHPAKTPNCNFEGDI